MPTVCWFLSPHFYSICLFWQYSPLSISSFSALFDFASNIYSTNPFPHSFPSFLLLIHFVLVFYLLLILWSRHLFSWLYSRLYSHSVLFFYSYGFLLCYFIILSPITIGIIPLFSSRRKPHFPFHLFNFYSDFLYQTPKRSYWTKKVKSQKAFAGDFVQISPSAFDQSATKSTNSPSVISILQPPNSMRWTFPYYK